MIKKYRICVLVLMLMSCSEEPVKPVDDFIVEVSSVRLPQRWNLNAREAAIVEIKIASSSGFSALAPVSMDVLNMSSGVVFSDLLYDDGGTSGSTDLIAGDGVFRNLFVGSQMAPESGDYLFNFYVNDMMDNNLLQFSQAASFNFNQAPQILNAPIVNLLESGAEAITLQVLVRDLDSAPAKVKVFLDLRFDNTSVFNEPVMLFNDGNTSQNGDVFAADSIHSIIIDSTFAAGKKGTYTLLFFARDEFEDESSALQNSIQLENESGYIISTNIPDTVFRPANIPVKARVGDPQGREDINRVYFELKASDGSYIESSPGNHLQLDMFDNGDTPANGDAVANDSEYSLILAVTEANVADVYTLEFYSVDKVANVSLMASDTLDIQ